MSEMLGYVNPKEQERCGMLICTYELDTIYIC